MRARACHEVVIGREINKHKNLVFTESSTIREILCLRKFPAIWYKSCCKCETWKFTSFAAQPKSTSLPDHGCLHLVKSRSCSSQPVPETILGRYATYLRSVYTKSEFPVYGKWPPSQSMCYVSLAAVSKNDITKEEAEELTTATFHGNIDKIVKRKIKRPIKIEHVLQTESGQRPKCVLVEGGPGVGKTTFSWEVCKRWGKGELFQEYTTVVLLQLRGERVQSAKRVSDLFYYTDEEVQRQIAAEITRRDGQDTLLVLDGLDELPKKLLIQDSVFG